MSSSWTSSTLVFVRDVDASIGFYRDLLGFTLNMRYEEEGRARVAGVSRGDRYALLLTDQWPDKVGSTIMYAALDPDAFASFRTELAAKNVPVEDGFWGKELLVIEDPDGNQLFFPHP